MVTITEDKTPQTIFSFEAPDAHVMGAEDGNPNGKAPQTILVMDNESDFGRWEIHVDD